MEGADGGARTPEQGRHRPGAPRFLAYDLMTGEAMAAGTGVRHLIAFIRDSLRPAPEEIFIEVVDCGADGPDAVKVALPLATARTRFVTVYRGAGVPGLVPIGIPNAADR